LAVFKTNFCKQSTAMFFSKYLFLFGYILKAGCSAFQCRL